jgi:hypothetical protein
MVNASPATNLPSLPVQPMRDDSHKPNEADRLHKSDEPAKVLCPDVEHAGELLKRIVNSLVASTNRRDTLSG